ncbi:ribonuclease HIII [Lysinibacillus odysseyi]|uniref:Ribonuclease HIII n=1 Tax=Lysinibacillus odysseyi 34hs-1 = NBRC 100172 TaxID=1220589 RepID=A0A0A3J8F2_9BACI|nr:ribonuclease HIII [Lysinibacillus odysseyi]KGR83297.1 ribonuclease HIII [Lysinibacillus odysseyi 34hs-1 = NBRC 100172]
MTNIVLQLSTEELAKVQSYYASDRIERNAPGVIFAAKLADTAITVYKSGKVMFQGAGAARESARFGTGKATAKTVSAAKGDTLPENFAKLSVIGSDETGTGDYFGPVTVAAVYVPTDKIELIKELGVKDSKQLTDEYMRKIAPDLMKVCMHSILTLRNDKYNTLQAKGYSQGKIKAMMHNQALKHVLDKISPEHPDYILIDQFAERGVYFNYLKNEKTVVQESVLFSTKAENLHVAVATASILARYAFLKEMDRLAETIGFPLQKGAGRKVDEMAARILAKHGEAVLKSMTKWHFANTEKAKVLLRKRNTN